MKKFKKTSQKLLSILLVVMIILPTTPLQALATTASMEVSDVGGPSEMTGEPTTGDTTPADTTTGEPTTGDTTTGETPPVADAPAGDTTAGETPPTVPNAPAGETPTVPVDPNAPAGETPTVPVDPNAPAGETPIVPVDPNAPPVVTTPVPPVPPLKEIFKLTITYKYGDTASEELKGKPVAKEYIAELLTGAEYSVVSPIIPGYAPDHEVIEGTLTKHTELEVIYNTSSDTKYTVNHIYEGLDGVDATETQELNGHANSMTNAIAHSTPGFSSEKISQIQIASDGSTVIDIRYTRNEYYIIFNTHNGDHVDTIAKKYGEKFNIADITKEPSRTGYTFKNWATDAEGKIPAEGFEMPANDVTLHAVWGEGQGKYTVVIWLEQADKNTSGTYDYDYHKSYSLTATVNSKVTPLDAYNSAMKDKDNTIPKIFEYDQDAIGNQTAIESLSGTGEEVLKVYLKRKTATITFYYNKDGKPSYEYTNRCSAPKHYSNGSHSWGDYRVEKCKKNKNDGWWYEPTPVENLILTGRIGELLPAPGWPYTVDGNPVMWRIAPGSSTYWTPMERIPESDQKAWMQETSGTKHTVFYCLEMAPDDTSTPDKVFKDKRYKYHTYQPVTVYRGELNITVKEDIHAIPGFSCNNPKEGENYQDFKYVDNKGKERHAFIYYKRDSATISFVGLTADVINPPSSIKQLFGTKIVKAPTNPSRVGYKFMGWNTGENGNGTEFKFDENTLMPAGGAILYPVWEAVKFDVTINQNYEGAPDATHIVVDYQKTVPVPEPPVREGYRFMGWYDASIKPANQYIFDKPVTTPLTLFAHWTPITVNSYTIKHVAKTKIGDKEEEKVLAIEQKTGIRLGETVTAFSKHFPGYAPVVASSSVKIVAGVNEIVLEYQKFSQLLYTVKYVDEAGNDLREPYIATDLMKSVVTVSALAIEGYTPNIFQQTKILLAENEITPAIITFVYKRNPVGYYITKHYVLKDPDIGYVLHTTTPVKEAPDATLVTAEPIEIEDYTAIEKTEGTVKSAHTQDKPLELRVNYFWDKYNTYFNITYLPNNTVLGNKPVIEAGVGYGKDVDSPSSETIAQFIKAEPHKILLGWSADKDAKTAQIEVGAKITNVTANMDLYAIWGNEAQYSLTYHANNDTNASVIAGDYYADDKITALNITDAKFDEPQGKKFVGWSKTATGGVDVNAGSVISIEADTDLYAVWIDKNKFAITYNGGEIDGNIATLPDGVTNDKAEFEENDTAIIAENKFVNAGYKFAGWKNGETILQPSDKLTITTNLELTATWTKDASQWSNLVYDANGGSGALEPVEYKIDGKPVNLIMSGMISPDSPKSIFMGWTSTKHAPVTDEATYDVAKASILSAVTLKAGADTTVYALWVVDENGPEGKPDGIPDAKQYKALYNDNDSDTPGLTPVDNKIYGEKTNVIVASAELLRDRAVFIGWSTEKLDVIKTQENETNIKNFYTEGSTYSMGKTNVTFHAVWAEDTDGDTIPDYKQLTVTYKAGPLDEDNEIITDANRYNRGEEVTVRENPFTIPGYMFTGWLSQDGTSAQPKDTFGIDKNMEFIAQWEVDNNGPNGKPDGIPDKQQFGIVYNLNGGDGVAPIDGNIYSKGYKAPVLFETDPTLVGHNFLGWSATQNSSAPEFVKGTTTTLVMPEKAVTLYAVYEAQNVSYTVSYMSYHIDKEGKRHDKEILAKMTGTGKYGQGIEINAVEIPGYTPVEGNDKTKTVILGLGENNHTFLYTPNVATVVANYVDEAGEKIAESKNWGPNYKFGISYTIDALDVPGFTAKTPSQEFTINGEIETITFVYTRNMYAYEVRYQAANGTTLVVPTKGTAAYKSGITAKYVPVSGYTPRATELSATIDLDETKNIVTFIYDRNTGGGGGGGGGGDFTDPDPDPPRTTPDPIPTPETPAIVPPTPPVAPIVPDAPPVVDVTPPEPVEIPDNDTPLAVNTPGGPTEIIDDNETALTAPPVSWALINLLLAILTVVITIGLFVTYYKKKKEDEEANKDINAENMQMAEASINEDEQIFNAEEESDKDELNRKGKWRLFSIIPSIIAVVAFIVTENIANPMALVDKWTLMMAVIAFVQIGVALLSRKKREDKDDNSNKQMPNNDVATDNI